MLRYEILIFIVISGISVYGLIGGGWVSNSKYRLLGAYRRISQMVSYEVRIIFVIIIIFFLSKGFKIRRLVVYNLFNLSLVYGMLVIFLVWVVVILAELNRAPFDFAEGESELVSGFNVEYGGEKFAFYFLAEYGVIIFIIYLTILIFMGSINFLILGIFLILWVRGCFPRFRYDNLMYLAWKVFLPFRIILLFLILIFIF